MIFCRSRTEVPCPAQNARAAKETIMLAIVAAILFAIGLILHLAGVALGPLDVIAFITAGLLCLALQLAGVGAGSTRSWRRSRL
jgi:Na+/H+ antiporter NhaB